MIQVREISEQKEWDSLVMSFPDHTFLQAWSWGEFKKSLQRVVLRYAYFDNEVLVGVATIVIEEDNYGKWLYTPYGPLVKWSNKKVFPQILQHLRVLAVSNKANYLTLDPQLEETPANKEVFISQKMVQAERYIQAQHKWLLDITISEEELLANMRKNTRYSINRAFKDGVIVKTSNNSEDIDKFMQTIKQTASRKHFFVAGKDYYEKQFETLARYDNMTLFWAEIDGRAVSSALIAHFGEHAAYLWGATSSNIPNKIPVAYPVLWEAIKYCKSIGVKTFDFWGITPPDTKSHEWDGFTFFKTGYGGYYKKLISPFDIPLTYKYWYVRFVVKLRKFWGSLSRLIKFSK